MGQLSIVLKAIRWANGRMLRALVDLSLGLTDILELRVSKV